MCQTTSGSASPVKNFSAATQHRAQLAYARLAWKSQETLELSETLYLVRLQSYKREQGRLLTSAGHRFNFLRIPFATQEQIATRAQQDANRITETYNRELFNRLQAIIDGDPEIRQSDLVERINQWNTQRSGWKDPQVALWADRDEVYHAQQDFYQRNRHNFEAASAHVEPLVAVCSICQGLINMGEVDMAVARANPCPVHVNCVHKWVLAFSLKPGARLEADWLFRNPLRNLIGN